MADPISSTDLSNERAPNKKAPELASEGGQMNCVFLDAMGILDEDREGFG